MLNGGSFASSIAKAYFCADSNNQKILTTAFKDLFNKYGPQMESQMITLPKLLSSYSIAQLLDFADRLDPNNGWRESIETDNSISRDTLCESMLAAYDDIDTYNWINK